MYRQKLHDERGDDEDWMKALLLNRLSRPGNQRLHLARRVERRRCFKHHAYLITRRIDGNKATTSLRKVLYDPR
jgi:hypothetical protein